MMSDPLTAIMARVAEAEKAISVGDYSTARDIQADLAAGGFMEREVAAPIIDRAIESARERAIDIALASLIEIENRRKA